MVTGWLDVQSVSLERSKLLECREITGAHTLRVHIVGVGIFLTLGKAKGLMGLKERRIISSSRTSFAAPNRWNIGMDTVRRGWLIWVREMRIIVECSSMYARINPQMEGKYIPPGRGGVYGTLLFLSLSLSLSLPLSPPFLFSCIHKDWQHSSSYTFAQQSQFNNH